MYFPVGEFNVQSYFAPPRTHRPQNGMGWHPGSVRKKLGRGGVGAEPHAYFTGSSGKGCSRPTRSLRSRYVASCNRRQVRKIPFPLSLQGLLMLTPLVAAAAAATNTNGPCSIQRDFPLPKMEDSPKKKKQRLKINFNGLHNSD